MKVYLFVRDLLSGQVIAIFELDSAFLQDETAIVEEKKDLSKKYAAPRYSITEARGPDLLELLRGFPDLGGSRRAVPIDLWRHRLTRYRYHIEKPPAPDRVDIEYVIEALDVPIGYLTDALGATLEGEPEKSFSDLQLVATTDARCDVKVVPLESRAKRLMTIGIHLWPPVEPGTKRSIALGYEWRGMWNPFRAVGEDHGVVTLSVQQTDRLEIELVLAAGMDRAELIRTIEVGSVEYLNRAGRQVLQWITAPASPGAYAYRVRVTSP